MVIRPVFTPRAVALKVTRIVQLAPPAKEAPQLLVCENPVPLTLMLVKLIAELPGLETTTACGELVVPTACAKARLSGAIEIAAGRIPLPAREIT
jgi:hypothetical protein